MNANKNKSSPVLAVLVAVAALVLPLSCGGAGGNQVGTTGGSVGNTAAIIGATALGVSAEGSAPSVRTTTASEDGLDEACVDLCDGLIELVSQVASMVASIQDTSDMSSLGGSSELSNLTNIKSCFCGLAPDGSCNDGGMDNAQTDQSGMDSTGFDTTGVDTGAVDTSGVDMTDTSAVEGVDTGGDFDLSSMSVGDCLELGEALSVTGFQCQEALDCLNSPPPAADGSAVSATGDVVSSMGR